MFVVLLLVSVVFGVLRFVVPVSGKIEQRDVYKDLAHIWVGLLFGVAIAFSLVEPVIREFYVDSVHRYWLLPIALTVLEVVAFIVRRKK